MTQTTDRRQPFAAAARNLALAFVLWTPLASAQVSPGDFIGACVDNSVDVIYANTPGTNTVRTITSFSTPSVLRAVVIGADNATLYAGMAQQIVGVAPGGSPKTVLNGLPFGVFVGEMQLDEDGRILVSTGANYQQRDGGVFRLDPVTRVMTTVIANIAPQGIAFDRRNGDVLVADMYVANQSAILRVKRDGTVATVATIPLRPFDLEYDPTTGDTMFGTQGTIFRLDRASNVTTFATNTFIVGTMHVYEDGRLVYGMSGRIFEYDRAGLLTATIYTGSAAWHSLTVADEHNVWGQAAPRVGTTFPLSIRFAGAPGKAYVAAASFASTPGIRVGGRTIPLAVDGLFVASRNLPTVFQGFSGVLDANGAAAASVAIPSVAALRGTRVFFAAIALDPAAPGGVAYASREYGVEIR